MTSEQLADLRAYVARRVPELSRPRWGGDRNYPSTLDAARQAKGEWMLAHCEAGMGGTLLREVIADLYGVPQ